MKKTKLKLEILNNRYGVCKLESGTGIPGWISGNGFFSITGTPDELSVVCEEELIPEDVQSEKGWRIFKVQGPLDFSLIGIISDISTCLAGAGVSIFAVSTYETDYIMVREQELDQAVTALTEAEYEILNRVNIV